MFEPVFVCALLFLIHTTTADTSNSGPCPAISPMKNFDPVQFAHGKWYHVAQDKEDQLHLLQNQKCVEKQGTYDVKTQTMEFDSHAISTVTNEPIQHKCRGKVTETPGVFKFTPENDTLPFEYIDFTIVDTDYKSFAIGYACAYDKNSDKYFYNVGVCLRHRGPAPAKILENTVKLFKSNGLDIELQPLDWSDCPAHRK